MQNKLQNTSSNDKLLVVQISARLQDRKQQAVQYVQENY